MGKQHALFMLEKSVRIGSQVETCKKAATQRVADITNTVQYYIEGMLVSG